MTEPDPRVVEKVARAIAKSNGDDFDAIPAHKREWVAKQGMFGGQFRDINQPFKSDYLDMGAAAILAMQDGPLPVVEFPRK